jgi:hypothetical protein
MSAAHGDQITFSNGATTGSVSADLESDEIISDSDELHFQFQVTNAGTPVASLYLLEQVHDDAEWTAVPIDKIQTPVAGAAGVTHTDGATAIAFSGNGGAGTSVVKFAIAGGAGRYKLFWDRTSGTGATAASGWVRKKAYA